MVDLVQAAEILVRELIRIIAEILRQPTRASMIDLDKIDYLVRNPPIESRGWTPTGPIYTKDSAPPPKRPRTLVVAARFKMIFLSVLGITIASGIAQVVMAAEWPLPTASQQSVFEAMGFAWKAGIGAIFGLLGGKAA